MDSSQILKKLFAAGYQLTPEAYEFLVSLSSKRVIIERIIKSKSDSFLLTIDEINSFREQAIDESNSKKKNILETEQSPFSEDKKTNQFSNLISNKQEINIEIIYSPNAVPPPPSTTSFQKYFTSRYLQVSSLFKGRKDITNIVGSSSLLNKIKINSMSFIGLIKSKTFTRKGSFILEIEDLEGSIKALIPSSKPDLIQQSHYILNDSVLCFKGTWSKDILFVNEINWPDIPYTHKPNRSDIDVCALFLSDIHIGSKQFSNVLFQKVIDFVNGKLKDSQYRSVGEKIKYIFIAGDLVEGVGVYPGQENDLVVDNIHMQYFLASEFIEKIRSDIEIFVIPGNHDGARFAEPQTPILRDYANELYELKNVRLLGSPAYIKVSGVEILMNHGNSIIDINAAIPNINHASSVPAMVEILRNRHLVPIYGQRTPIAPEAEDSLFLSRIPDVFHTGHTHLAADGYYKGITLINSGTFQLQTDYQKSMNINPNTGISYIMNLKTLQRTRIDFNQIM